MENVIESLFKTQKDLIMQSIERETFDYKLEHQEIDTICKLTILKIKLKNKNL